MDVPEVPTISVGELFSGFKGGSREVKNREELEIFLDYSFQFQNRIIY